MEEILKIENRDRLYKFLITDHGMTKIDEMSDSKAFGNFSITLESSEFFIRYISDKSYLTIEIASNSIPPKWYDLSYVKNFIEHSENINPENNDTNEIRIGKLNDFLRKHFDLIGDLFDRDNYHDTKEKLDRLLKSQFYKNFGSDDYHAN